MTVNQERTVIESQTRIMVPHTDTDDADIPARSGILAYDTLSSDCCNSRVDFIRDVDYGSFYYLCRKCLKPCKAVEVVDEEEHRK